MEKQGVYIRLFGHFNIEYNGKTLVSTKNRHAVHVRLLIILLAHYQDGISRENLISYLFQEQEIADTANSLRVAMHRLRTYIRKLGLPNDNYIIFEDGKYKCNREVFSGIDLEDFLNSIQKSRAKENTDEKIKYLLRTCQIYRGEFLEEASTEEWVILRSVRYKSMYDEAVWTLLNLLREKKDYKLMLEVSTVASKIYPYDEWQVDQIESLTALGRSQEAYDVYNETMHQYNDELEIKMPEHMLKRIQSITMTESGKEEAVGTIGSKLEEKIQEPGAIYLSPYSFVDTFRFMARVAERNHQSMCLMVCVLKENAYTPMKNPEIIENAANALIDGIKESLRKGDCYTRYNDTQFLILLVGTEEEKCDIVFRRVNSRFRKNRRAWNGSLHYYVETIKTFNKGTGKVQLYNQKLYIDEDI